MNRQLSEKDKERLPCKFQFAFYGNVAIREYPQLGLRYTMYDDPSSQELFAPDLTRVLVMSTY